MSIREDVRIWLSERLPVWIDDEDEWFDDYTKSIIPDFLVDPEILQEIRGENVERLISERMSVSLSMSRFSRSQPIE